MIFKQYIKFVCTLSLVLISNALSADQHGHSLMIKDVWAREAPPTAFNGAVYLVIHNSGKTDRLLGGSTPAADAVELHTHVHENGLMKMQRLPQVEIPGAEVTEFKPGARHIMLFGLHQPLTAASEFDLKLEFERAGEISLVVQVFKDGQQPMPSMKHSE